MGEGWGRAGAVTGQRAKRARAGLPSNPGDPGQLGFFQYRRARQEGICLVRKLAKVTLLVSDVVWPRPPSLPLCLVLNLFSGAVFMTLQVKAVCLTGSMSLNVTLLESFIVKSLIVQRWGVNCQVHYRDTVEPGHYASIHFVVGGE